MSKINIFVFVSFHDVFVKIVKNWFFGALHFPRTTTERTHHPPYKRWLCVARLKSWEKGFLTFWRHKSKSLIFNLFNFRFLELVSSRYCLKNFKSYLTLSGKSYSRCQFLFYHSFTNFSSIFMFLVISVIAINKWTILTFNVYSNRQKACK